ncbi:hypothetical protein ACWNYH_00275 [Candidatus Vidania fulgoroideorum]
MKIHLPIYPNLHPKTISNIYEFYRFKKRISIFKQVNFITQFTFDLLSLRIMIKKLNITKSELSVGLPIILKKKLFFKFTKSCNIPVPIWFKKSTFKSKRKFILEACNFYNEFIITLNKLNFNRIQFFTLNRIKDVNLFIRRSLILK